ncbi:MAG: chromate transporter [Clostridia bacterium]|nr:chromate transporter [Clostridia bacterium]
MIYLELLLGFLKVGLFSFGGYGAIPLVRETVLAYGWLDDSQLSELIAVSESTPGPIMVNMATYVGSVRGGILGALIATTAVVLPAFLIILLFIGVLKKAKQTKGFQAAANALNPCIIGIILGTGIYMAAKNIFQLTPAFAVDYRALALTAVLAAVYFGAKKIFKKGMSPILLIFISGALGVGVTMLFPAG